MLYLTILLWSPFLFSQKQISIEEIPNHIGKKIKICDKIYGSYIVKSNGMTLLNVGKPYPDNTLTLVIYEKDLKNFSYLPSEFLPDKTFCATGKLILYKGKPEIVLKSEKDIELTEEIVENYKSE